MNLVAVLDANVLIPNALCDLLLRLAEEDVYAPRWSEEILDEVRRNLPGMTAVAIERRLSFMKAAFEDALVENYEYLIGSMTNHPKDRHVLAAAVATAADVIITCNLKDFCREACEPHGVEAEAPDDFLLEIFSREPVLMIKVIHNQAKDTGRRGPQLSVAEILNYLDRAGAPRFASTVRKWLHEAVATPADTA